MGGYVDRSSGLGHSRRTSTHGHKGEKSLGIAASVFQSSDQSRLRLDSSTPNSACERSDRYHACLEAKKTIQSKGFKKLRHKNQRSIKAIQNFSFAAAQVITETCKQNGQRSIYLDSYKRMMGITTRRQHPTLFSFDTTLLNADNRNVPLDLKQFENMQFNKFTFSSVGPTRVVSQSREERSNNMVALKKSIQQMRKEGRTQDEKYYHIQYHRLQQQQLISTGIPQNTDSLWQAIRDELAILEHKDVSTGQYTYNYGWRDSWFQTRDARIKELHEFLGKKIKFKAPDSHGPLHRASDEYHVTSYSADDNTSLMTYLDSFYKTLSAEPNSKEPLTDLDKLFYDFLDQYQLLDTFRDIFTEKAAIQSTESQADSMFMEGFQHFNDRHALPLLRMFNPLPDDQKTLERMAFTCNAALPSQYQVDFKEITFVKFLTNLGHQLLYNHLIEMNALESKKPNNRLVDPDRQFKKYDQQVKKAYKTLSDTGWRVSSTNSRPIFKPLQKNKPFTLSNIEGWQDLIKTGSKQYRDADEANQIFNGFNPKLVKSQVSKIIHAFNKCNHYDALKSLHARAKLSTFKDIDGLGQIIYSCMQKDIRNRSLH